MAGILLFMDERGADCVAVYSRVGKDEATHFGSHEAVEERGRRVNRERNLFAFVRASGDEHAIVAAFNPQTQDDKRRSTDGGEMIGFGLTRGVHYAIENIRFESRPQTACGVCKVCAFCAFCGLGYLFQSAKNGHKKARRRRARLTTWRNPPTAQIRDMD